MPGAFLSEDSLEQDVLSAKPGDVIVHALSLLKCSLINGQLLIVFKGIKLVREQFKLLCAVQECFLWVLQLLQQLIRPLCNYPQH